MKKGTRHLTISIPLAVEEGLRKAKEEVYYNDTKSDVIRELILLGLTAFQQEKMKKSKHGDS